MQILTRDQISAWDEYTIAHEPISQTGLMERAAKACFDWLMTHGYSQRSFTFFCSKGNNGGDGLALARMLSQSHHPVKVFILEFGTKGTDAFQENLVRLHQTAAEIRFISTEETIAPVDKNHVVVDALLGSGLNRPVEGLTAALVEHINHYGTDIISIDIPSGLYPDRSSVNNRVVCATHTLSFQCYKLAFFMAENEPFTGKVHILSIGLHPGFPTTVKSTLQTVEKEFVRSMLLPRKKFSHKGNYGHAGLIAGSRDMMGAAVLCARAITKSGAGKLTCHIPAIGYTIMQVSVPEAMTRISKEEDFITRAGSLNHYNALAVGPGLGKNDSHAKMLAAIFSCQLPLVIDADALNTIAENPHLRKELKPGAVLTPHPGEFSRLFGKTSNDFETMALALQQASALKSIIVLKGACTFIATPDGEGFFNTTGNPGMAKGGSGDVLTGLIAGLLAQGHSPANAAILGVYIHGMAGDFAARKHSPSSMTASDIINHFDNAFLALGQQ